MEGADGDPGRTLREGSAQSQSRLSSWDHNIMFELWFQRTAPDRRGRACRAAAGGRAGTLRGSAGSSPVWRSQRHRKGQRRSGGCLRTLRHIFLNAELQTSIYDGYSCSVGSPLTDPQRQILRINRAREKKTKNTQRYQPVEKMEMHGANRRSLHLQRHILLMEATGWKAEAADSRLHKKRCEKSLSFISLSIHFIDTRSFRWSCGIPQEDISWQLSGKLISSRQEEKR